LFHIARITGDRYINYYKAFDKGVLEKEKLKELPMSMVNELPIQVVADLDTAPRTVKDKVEKGEITKLR